MMPSERGERHERWRFRGVDMCWPAVVDYRIPAPVAVGDVRVVFRGHLEVLDGPSDCEAGLKVGPDEPG